MAGAFFLALALVLFTGRDSADANSLGRPPVTVAVRLPPPASGNVPPDPGAGAAAAYTPPRLSAADLAKAKTLLANDGYLTSLLSGTSYTIERSVPWWGQGRTTVVGALVDLRLARPVSASNTFLPAIESTCHEGGYEQFYLHARIDRATTLSVQVDFRTEKVVRVDPPSGTATELPGNRHEGQICNG